MRSSELFSELSSSTKFFIVTCSLLCLLPKVKRREPNQVKRREPARPRTAEDSEMRRRSLPQAPTYSRSGPNSRQSNTPPQAPASRKSVTPRTGQLAAPRYDLTPAFFPTAHFFLPPLTTVILGEEVIIRCTGVFPHDTNLIALEW